MCGTYASTMYECGMCVWSTGLAEMVSFLS